VSIFDPNSIRTVGRLGRAWVLLREGGWCLYSIRTVGRLGWARVSLLGDGVYIRSERWVGWVGPGEGITLYLWLERGLGGGGCSVCNHFNVLKQLGNIYYGEEMYKVK
jgi:hypothetical protein